MRTALVLTLAVAAVPVVLEGCGSDRPPASGESGQLGGSVVSGPCTQNGQTKACHVETGRVGNVVNCFSGTQTCEGGLWTACGAGSTGTLSTFDLSLAATSASDLSPLTVTPSGTSADAGGCASNPCNPYCLGVDVDAGAMQPDGGFTQTVILGSVVDYSSFPTAKKNAMLTTCTPTTPPGIAPADYKVCSYDYCCKPTGATGSCVKWIDPGSSACQECTGVDFTVGVGCNDGTNIHIPVCNRGATDATTGTLLLAGYPANPNAAGSITVCQNPGAAPSEGCSINLAVKPLPAGKCVDINIGRAAANQVPGVKCNAASNFGSGNRTTMINPPGTNFSGLTNLGFGSGAYTQLGECNNCNNYSFVFTQTGSCATYGEQPPPPASETFTYVADCQPGTRVQWNQFAYSTVVPATSEVSFTAQTAPRLADGGAGTFTLPVPIARPKSGGPDPAVCTMAGFPAGCPRSLATALGAPANASEILQIGVTLIATTALPTVNSWQVSFSCIPAE